MKLLSESEFEMTQWMKIDEIEIKDRESEETIRRKVTDISLIGMLLGFNLVCFSWKGLVEK